MQGFFPPPAVSVLLDEHEYGYKMLRAPKVTEDMRYIHHRSERLIRWYHYIDIRFKSEDMYAKLYLHYGNEQEL